MSFNYELFGLLLETDLPLVALDACTVQCGVGEAKDVIIRRGQVPDHIDDETGRRALWSRNLGEFLFEVPGIGRFHVADGNRITYAAAKDIDDGKIEPYLLGSCLAAVLHQRAMPVLHAASVVKHGQAFAICGPSGAGKSTTATRLVSRGAQILSDDLTVFSNEPMPMVLRGYPQSKLKHDAYAALSSMPFKTRDLPVETGKIGIDLRNFCAPASAPLSAIFLLRPVEDREPEIMQLEPVTALSALVPMVYRRIFLSQAEFAVTLSFLTNLVARIPVFHIGRPLDQDSTEFVLSKIEGVLMQNEPVKAAQ